MKTTKWLIVVLLAGLVAMVISRRATERGDASVATTDEIVTEDDTEKAARNSARTVFGTSRWAAASARVADAADELKSGNHLTVIVQNEAGQPLEGASVSTVFRGDGRRPVLTNLNRTFITSAQGVAAVLWPTQSFAQFELLASKEGFAPRKMIWDLVSGDRIPATYTMKLSAGVQIGGVVLDPDGNPLSEAKVRLSRFWRGGEERKLQGEDSGFSYRDLTTGLDGRWTAGGLPGDLMHRIGLEGTHSNYVGVYLSIEGNPQAESELRAGTLQLRLLQGLEARGRVINEQQQPLPDATVWAGRRFTRERQKTTTDEQGRFTFRNLKEGKLDFSASATGYAPGVTSHTVSTGATDEIVLQLAKGSTIRGVVQDGSGQPIQDVRVVVDGGPGDPSYDRYEFSTRTDSAGRFEWTSAPNEPMPFYFGKTGYEQKRGVRLRPNADNVVTLRLNRQIEGQVLDAETDKPVTRFSVAVGRTSVPDRFYASSGTTRNFNHPDGLFTIESHEENDNAIEVTSEGYAEQTQALPSANERQSKLIVKLKPSLTLTGIVVTADSQPVQGASVALVDGNRTAQISLGQLRTTGARGKLSSTDASGRFTITSPPESGTIVATHTAGYGSATLAELKASGVLVLQSLGRIEGVLLQGTAPGTGQEVLLSSEGTTGLSFDFGASKQAADAEGRFVFESVPPGQVTVVRLVKTSARSWSHSHRTRVTVKPGETTQVVLGGVDATIHAHARMEAPLADNNYMMRAQLNTVRPEIPASLSAEERRAFVSSPEYRAALQNINYYTAVVREDGSLVLDSIPPGQYTLRVTAQKRDDESFSTRALASGEINVTIPAGANPASPLHVGEVILKPAR